MKKEAAHPGERIAKYMARAGLCSRREAEAWIADGRVAVNGKTINSPALNVTATDKIVVDGRAITTREPIRLWRFNKPKDCLTTNVDPSGRATVFDYIPSTMPRVMTVGRLDYTTEGLLLLTNDGDFARYLEHPSTGLTRRYRVRAHGHITKAIVDKLARGVTIEGIRYRPAEIEVEAEQGSNVWLYITLTEGKNREVKKLLNYVGLDVTRLIRVDYGPFQLGKLPRSATDEVPTRAMRQACAEFFKDKE